MQWIEKPWGRMITYAHNLILDSGSQQKTVTVKILEANPGARLSDQRHASRQEHWKVLSPEIEIEIEKSGERILRQRLVRGDTVIIPAGTWHRLGCPANALGPCQVLEVSTGEFDEDDIERRADDYGRMAVAD